ncbi:Endochitinase B [Camellia lanceoleosa]|uniref:Endochitinase B n=1 Tax=Camellia lanceoleosa TaxID=1840588 RepID=A0ACC0IFV6_9ERIC|nr:Endochitinase B [Camellia lanceoleosa]
MILLGGAPGERFVWGYCHVKQVLPLGEALGLDLLNNPDLVETDPVISFRTTLWFWMTTQSPKPSCHDVIIGNLTPMQDDKDAGRVPGYGAITNIINGGLECGHGQDTRVEDHIGFYKRYCSDEIFDASTGDNLDCNNQGPFRTRLLLDSM